MVILQKKAALLSNLWGPPPKVYRNLSKECLMATITLKGNRINTCGNLPSVGGKLPDFKLTAQDLSVKSLKDFAGKTLILNIFPSIDTDTCATSVRRFKRGSGQFGGGCRGPLYIKRSSLCPNTFLWCTRAGSGCFSFFI